jgi:hypothetical protein
LENVPEGSYRALRFHVGPDAAANAADVSKIPAGHALNPNPNGLHWSWQGGYIFMAVVGHFRKGNSEVNGFAHHLDFWEPVSGAARTSAGGNGTFTAPPPLPESVSTASSRRLRDLRPADLDS